MPADKKPFARLPDNVAPRHYRILLKPDLESLTFSGSVTVTLTVKGPGPVHSLVCNAADLTDFFDVRVNGATVDAAKVGLFTGHSDLPQRVDVLLEVDIRYIIVL